MRNLARRKGQCCSGPGAKHVDGVQAAYTRRGHAILLGKLNKVSLEGMLFAVRTIPRVIVP